MSIYIHPHPEIHINIHNINHKLSMGIKGEKMDLLSSEYDN